MYLFLEPFIIFTSHCRPFDLHLCINKRWTYPSRCYGKMQYHSFGDSKCAQHQYTS